MQKNPHIHPAKLPLKICCKKPPHIVEIRMITDDNNIIAENIKGINNVIINLITQPTVLPMSGFIRLAKNKNKPCINCRGIDHDFI